MKRRKGWNERRDRWKGGEMTQ